MTKKEEALGQLDDLISRLLKANLLETALTAIALKLEYSR